LTHLQLSSKKKIVGRKNTGGILFQYLLKVKGREAGVCSALQLEEADCTLTP
jgi:hypothetical protein